MLLLPVLNNKAKREGRKSNIVTQIRPGQKNHDLLLAVWSPCKHLLLPAAVEILAVVLENMFNGVFPLLSRLSAILTFQC